LLYSSERTHNHRQNIIATNSEEEKEGAKMMLSVVVVACEGLRLSRGQSRRSGWL